jgi:hypothetical protein
LRRDFQAECLSTDGTFKEYGKAYSLSGSIQGHSITFTIPFPGPRPYIIEFAGTIDLDGDKIRGTSGLADEGLKRQNNSPDKLPDDDDNNRRR